MKLLHFIFDIVTVETLTKIIIFISFLSIRGSHLRVDFYFILKFIFHFILNFFSSVISLEISLEIRRQLEQKWTCCIFLLPVFIGDLIF